MDDHGRETDPTAASNLGKEKRQSDQVGDDASSSIGLGAR
jgi:hypothetical protein